MRKREITANIKRKIKFYQRMMDDPTIKEETKEEIEIYLNKWQSELIEIEK